MEDQVASLGENMTLYLTDMAGNKRNNSDGP